MVKQYTNGSLDNYEEDGAISSRTFLQQHRCENVESPIISVKANISIKQSITSMLTSLYGIQLAIIITALNTLLL